MKSGIKDKVALVTGSSRGIGRAIALRLAREGASVVVNYSGSEEQATSVVEEIQRNGGQAIAVRADISQVTEVKRLFDATIVKFGKLDIVVNNAGTLFTNAVADTTEADFDRLMSINVKGTFFCCQEACKRLGNGGRIINFSSTTTVLMLPGYAAYVASKGAVEQLSHVLAKELGSRNITVNVVSPGPTDTELFGEGKSEEEKQSFGRMAALGRLGQPEDIAAVVAMLASEDAGWITGQNIRANGGLI